eukprot:241112_1
MSTEYGHVKFFNSGRGFGFIRRKPQPDIFFHVSDVIAVDPHKPLGRGDKVEFVAIVDHKKNKWKASRVKKTSKPFTDVPAVTPNKPKRKQACDQCCGEVTKCKDHWIYVDFHRPDGGVETKSIGWCVDNDFEEVSPGVWSGPWYHKDTKHSNYCYDNDTKEESESEDDEWDVVDMSENIGYNGMPKYMEDELLCQGIKPWDDCAMSALSVLFD